MAEDWPMDEMRKRASLQTFWVALFPVAFFSGLGVPVSFLDDQTASLVGVAISASLLPPPVNAGIVWIYWAYIELEILPDPTTSDEKLGDRGLLSLFLTLANFLLIWVASMLMFRMKEVLPIEKKSFGRILVWLERFTGSEPCLRLWKWVTQRCQQ